MKRRAILKDMTAAALIPLMPSLEIPDREYSERKFQHSVCRWCYNDYPLEELCDRAKQIGIQSVELLDPADWDTVLNRGLNIALANGSPLGITKGWNTIKYHGELQRDLMQLIPMAADKGIKQIIVFSGNRNGMSDPEGIENCAQGLDPIVKYAQQYNVTLVMELLNSTINHPDYQCDHTAWGVTLVDKIGSAHFKLLYDIYHMQVMEGNVIQTILDQKDYIAHYHTAGVPGRHEIDDTQELYYPAIMRAIASCNFNGYVAQEFIPRSADPWISLREAVRICSV